MIVQWPNLPSNCKHDCKTCFARCLYRREQNEEQKPVENEEQSEDVVLAANALLEALSKTPYNNKPITDAQIVVKQLLLFFENPKEYNPDAILEQPEVDLEKAIDEYFGDGGQWKFGFCVGRKGFLEFARHFYELGLNTKIEKI